MEKQVICLELTPNQLKHLLVLSEALCDNSSASIRDLQFPREFREKFNEIFFVRTEEPQPLFESTGSRQADRVKPTNLMLALRRFHFNKKK